MKTVGTKENALVNTLSSCPNAQIDSMQVKHSLSGPVVQVGQSPIPKTCYVSSMFNKLRTLISETDQAAVVNTFWLECQTRMWNCQELLYCFRAERKQTNIRIVNSHSQISEYFNTR